MQKIGELLNKYPFLDGFFSENDYDITNYMDKTFEDFLNDFSPEYFEDKATTKENLLGELDSYIAAMKEFLGISEGDDVKSLTIISGNNSNSRAYRSR